MKAEQGVEDEDMEIEHEVEEQETGKRCGLRRVEKERKGLGLGLPVVCSVLPDVGDCSSSQVCNCQQHGYC